jgi:CelD/BcsL family acetyltransferase involved in cellulose biosynthesis
MHFDVYRAASAFEALKMDWNALVERGICRAPFLRAEYQQAWWRHKGGGEWPQAELLLLAAREGPELAGLAPLFSAHNRDGRRALLFVGSIEISDYLDAVVTRAQAERFWNGALERLTAADIPEWEVLDLYNIPATSPTRAALGRAAAQRGWHAAETRLEPVPEITLPRDWDTYLATLVEKKERQEIRRKIRRAEGNDPPVTWRIVTTAPNILEEAEAFLSMMSLSEDKARFLTPAMRAQFLETIRAANEHGWLHLSFLEVGAEKAAAYLSFDYGNRLYVYNSAIDPRFNALSTGWVLLGYLLKWAIEQGRATFDFMRGGEDYKFRFGGVARQIYRVQVSRTLSAEALGGAAAITSNPEEAECFPPDPRPPA